MPELPSVGWGPLALILGPRSRLPGLRIPPSPQGGHDAASVSQAEGASLIQIPGRFRPEGPGLEIDELTREAGGPWGARKGALPAAGPEADSGTGTKLGRLRAPGAIFSRRLAWRR